MTNMLDMLGLALERVLRNTKKRSSSSMRIEIATKIVYRSKQKSQSYNTFSSSGKKSFFIIVWRVEMEPSQVEVANLAATANMKEKSALSQRLLDGFTQNWMLE